MRERDIDFDDDYDTSLPDEETSNVSQDNEILLEQIKEKWSKVKDEMDKDHDGRFNHFFMAKYPKEAIENYLKKKYPNMIPTDVSSNNRNEKKERKKKKVGMVIGRGRGRGRGIGIGRGMMAISFLLAFVFHFLDLISDFPNDFLANN